MVGRDLMGEAIDLVLTEVRTLRPLTPFDDTEDLDLMVNVAAQALLAIVGHLTRKEEQHAEGSTR